MTPQGSKTAQVYELQLGLTTLATFASPKLLKPLLIEDIKIEDPSRVRAVGISSMGAKHHSLVGGFQLDNLDYEEDESPFYKYGVTKAGSYFHAAEYAHRHKEDGIVSVALRPGLLESDLRHVRAFCCVFLAITHLMAFHRYEQNRMLHNQRCCSDIRQSMVPI